MNSPVEVISDICAKGKQPTRANILAYEEMAKKLPQVKIPPKHYIHGGMYAREITIPKGTLITGQIYKFDHLDIMISGDITVSTENGERKRITGYHCFMGESGKKRAGYAHEDTTWITVHPFGEDFSDDGETIQRFLTANNFEELNEFNRLVNIKDYGLVLSEVNMTKEEVRSQSENTDDMTDLPSGFDYCYTKKSTINGLGFFCKKTLHKGDIICPARINGKRTIAGRYVNHALTANANMDILDNRDVMLVANRTIEEGEEITINYRRMLKQRLIKGDLCQE